jgi:glyoxalase family protein
MKINGLHHVTAIAGDPQRNLDFYSGVLGLRLAKRTINFDDPGTYHFYFGDSVGSPGTILTFFPWAGIRRGTRGTGEVTATAYSVPTGSLDYWVERLREHQVTAERAGARFGEEVLRLADPDGMQVELIESAAPSAAKRWVDNPVPAEYALQGFHGVTPTLDETERTELLLTEVFGYEKIGAEGDRTRYAATGDALDGRYVDLVHAEGRYGRQGAGSVHHIAFRAADDAEQKQWRELLVKLGFHVSEVRDRTYFNSIYFREPGGVLFEIATDGPGFTWDEPEADLGTGLKLPGWLEPRRKDVEDILPKIVLPQKQ